MLTGVPLTVTTLLNGMKTGLLRSRVIYNALDHVMGHPGLGQAPDKNTLSAISVSFLPPCSSRQLEVTADG